MKLRTLLPAFILLFTLLGLLKTSTFVYGDDQATQGFTSFEEGTDGAVIRDTIPGLHFTNTDGQDWIYGDWRTGNYNGKYPDGAYISNGNFFAWLGAAQGSGRIDFTGGSATYLSVWVSAGEPVQLTAYYASGQIADRASLDSQNIHTGQLANLKVTAPFPYKIQYVIISGTANYWLIDDLSTDADGVPDQRIPVIFVPGVAGSKLENDPNGDGKFEEVWPNVGKLILPGSDSFLDVLRLQVDGKGPWLDTQEYKSVRPGDIIRREVFNFSDTYGTTVDYFTSHGYTEDKDFFVCPYDWRKDFRDIATGSLNKTLDQCVNRALEANPSATQVNILAHSMGGLVARTYIANTTKAQTVKRLITLGTPYLGAPKVAMGVIDKLCFVEKGVCLSNPDTIHNLIVNFPSSYQLAPSDAYFQVYPQGYIRRDRDLNQDGVYDGPLTVVQSYDMLAVHNQTLAHSARTFMSTIKGWNSGTNGVEVYVMVGDQHGTPITIVEYEKTPWYNPWATPEVGYRIERIDNGDGTVPLHSADMRSPLKNVDLSGGTSVFYFNADHGGLPLDTSLLQLAIDIFTSGAPPAATAQVASVSSSDILSLTLSDEGILRDSRVKASSISAAPRTQPLPLNGHLITLDGPVTIGVFDSNGNYIGDYSGNENFSNTIPGAGYYELGSSAAVFLQNDSIYDVRIYGHDNASTDVRIQQVVNNELIQTVLYDDLPVTTNSIAQLSFDPTISIPGNFALDQNGDGVQDITLPPTSVLDQVESQDHVAPKTTISVEGETTPEGWYVGQVDVTMTAFDNEGGTGVAKIEYSLDNGKTVQAYTQPFSVDSSEVNFILAKATDRAGNEEFPLAKFTLTPPQILLSPDSSTITADGVSASTISAKVVYHNGDPVVGEVVTFMASLGTIDPFTRTTNLEGVATIALTAGTKTGAAVVTASTGETSEQTTVAFVAGPPVTISVTATPTTTVADGANTSTVTVVVQDTFGNLVVNQEVSFSTTLGRITNSATTDVNGTATATLTAPTTPGAATITASTGTISGNASVEFVAGPPATISVTATPTTTIADGASTSIVTAVVQDTFGNLVAGAEVSFTTSLGTITSSATTDVNGVAVATLTAALSEGVATVNATLGAASGTTQVVFTNMGGKDESLLFLPFISR